MKKSSQVIGLPIMGIKEGLECGIVQDIVVDPQEKKIKSIILRGQKNEYDFRELKLSDIVGIGKDYVITPSIENTKSVNSAATGMTLQNMKCIADSGDILGNVSDFSFEEKTGEIQSLKIDAGLEVNGNSILSLSNNLIFVGNHQAAPVVNNIESSLEKEQADYMLGRIVKADITDEAGNVIIKKDTKVTADTIGIAEEAGVMIDLTLNL